MPDKKLVVIGDGPDFEKVKKIAGENTTLMGFQPLDVLKDYMSKAKAVIFAAEEDFGIVPVEAQACGTPVIAFDKGGVKESVIEGVTGIFFKRQTTESIQDAVKRSENMSFDPMVIRRNAERFSKERFKKEINHFVVSKQSAQVDIEPSIFAYSSALI